MIEFIRHFFGLCPDAHSHLNLFTILVYIPIVGYTLKEFVHYIMNKLLRCKCKSCDKNTNIEEKL